MNKIRPKNILIGSLIGILILPVAWLLFVYIAIMSKTAENYKKYKGEYLNAGFNGKFHYPKDQFDTLTTLPNGAVLIGSYLPMSTWTNYLLQVNDHWTVTSDQTEFEEVTVGKFKGKRNTLPLDCTKLHDFPRYVNNCGIVYQFELPSKKLIEFFINYQARPEAIGVMTTILASFD